MPNATAPIHPAWLRVCHWLGGALQWHFAAMWLLVGNGLVYLGLNLATGRIAASSFR